MRGDEYTKSHSASRARAFALARAVAEPFMRQAVAVVSCCVPLMLARRSSEGWLITTTWPPEVQATLDVLSRLARGSVEISLYGAAYGDQSRSAMAHEARAQFDSLLWSSSDEQPS